MRTFRTTATCATALAGLVTLSACGGGSTTAGGGDNSSPKTLTYWASNQGPNLQADKKVLKPELKRFQEKTGITVKLEVIPWSDLLKRILAATSSGQGPDVLNIGNTWSASLQATGALLPWTKKEYAKIGGKDRFMSSAVAATGTQGKSPVAVPLYSLSYALYYNKEMFRKAGITHPPRTWKEMIKDGKKLTHGDTWGLGVEGANLSTNTHQAFTLGKQHGADFFDKSGNPTFTKPGAVSAVKQFVDFMAHDGIIAPGNAEYAQNQSLKDFATGKTGMLLWQNAESTFAAHGMKPDEYGVTQVPVRSGKPGTGRQTNSIVGGINLAVFKDTHNIDGARKFVKFMTSKREQRVLNSAFNSIPPVTKAQQDKEFSEPVPKVLRKTLATSAAPLPQVPKESQFETAVGTAIKDLFADAAAGRTITRDAVRKKLAKAQQQMRK